MIVPGLVNSGFLRFFCTNIFLKKSARDSREIPRRFSGEKPSPAIKNARAGVHKLSPRTAPLPLGRLGFLEIFLHENFLKKCQGFSRGLERVLGRKTIAGGSRTAGDKKCPSGGAQALASDSTPTSRSTRVSRDFFARVNFTILKND